MNPRTVNPTRTADISPAVSSGVSSAVSSAVSSGVSSAVSSAVSSGVSSGARTRQRVRVLVADDNAMVTTMLRRMLTRLDVDADVVHDGQAAIAALASTRYHLLLLDLSMPVRTGLDVLRWLRSGAKPPGPSPHVVVMSASAFDERPTLTGLGVTRLLPKPFRLEDLAAIVHKAATC